MNGSSDSTQTTTPVYHTSPNALGTTDYNTSADLFRQLQGLTTAGPTQRNIGDFGSYGDVTGVGNFGSYGDITGVGDFGSYGDVYNVRDTASSPFSQSLENALLNPSYGARTGNEQALLNSLMDVTAGRGAVSGLGAPTQSSLATSIAPTLVSLNDQYIKNLMAAKEGDITAGLTARGQDIGMRGQDIQRNLGLREGDIGMRSADIQRNLGLREGDIGMRGADMERNLGLRGQDIQINAQQIQSWMAALQSLAELAGLAMPQEVITSSQEGTSGSQTWVEDIIESFSKW
jgi:hypothetical protein